MEHSHAQVLHGCFLTGNSIAAEVKGAKALCASIVRPDLVLAAHDDPTDTADPLGYA